MFQQKYPVEEIKREKFSKYDHFYEEIYNE